MVPIVHSAMMGESAGAPQHSPASSAASSQESASAQRQQAARGQLAGAKKRSSSASGLNRTLGRLFGKREKVCVSCAA